MEFRRFNEIQKRLTVKRSGFVSPRSRELSLAIFPSVCSFREKLPRKKCKSLYPVHAVSRSVAKSIRKTTRDNYGTVKFHWPLRRLSENEETPGIRLSSLLL